MLEIRHLRTLIALAESGSVSRAAERLHLTQSALSHQLRALESHYGLAVVRRKGQTVALSEAGERLLELAHKVVADIQAAERDLERIKGRAAGTLRIALECHTCFDWLMPVMDAFRQRWPEVELDLVSGFHADPLALLKEGRADVVIGSEPKPRRGVVFAPLFRFEILAVLPVDHPLRSRKWLEAKDFAGQTLITYPVPEERIDLIRQVLAPAGVPFTRRTTELTIAVLQLVASRRGLAALPSWGIRNYVDYEYVIAKRVGREGVWSNLYAAMARDYAAAPFAQDFIETAKSICFAQLPGVMALE
ncbi:LysR family transcriptional regulator [Ralstonia syzygii]|uniref:HTH-type transcriptional regulator MetR n=1 Tax=Ralstonia syzygii R24 TaxID=907261 RepID=G3A992_9RALS|nr:LysR family transcriptional regulator [Ralstonia syzygii]CCA87841.1 transcriptional regulator of methionine biosynthesis (LysR family) [Ralstonia syzygii R24]